MKKKRTANVLAAVLVLFCLVYIGYQVLSSYYAPYKTEVAVVYTVADDVPCSGVAVRDEITLSDIGDGACVYLISDGDKIAKNAAIAEIYGDVTALEQKVRLEKLSAERDLLIKLQNSQIKSTDFSSAQDELYDALSQYASNIADERLEGYSDSADSLMSALGIYYLHTSRATDYASRLEYLNGEITELNSSAGSPVDYIYAPETGYFVTNTDGFESLVNKTSAMDLTVAEVEALAKTQPAFTTNSKLVSGYEWYYLAIVDGQYAQRFTAGSSLTLNFNYAGVNDLPVTVVAVKSDDSSDKALVILSCDYFNAGTASLRLESASVSFSNYSGIKVDRSALRMEDGVLGVYIKYGGVVKFRKVTPVFETENYILVSDSSSDSEELRLYDEIITEGRDLYVGKELQ